MYVANNGFHLLQGVETLPLRMERHVSNARKLAQFLSESESVEWGSFELTKIDNDHIEINWNPNSQHSDFGSGSINLQRLTKIESLGCD